MIIRRIEPEDAGNVSALIVRTLREVNTKDYSREYIENDVQKLQPKDILERAKWTHFYVVCDEDKIVGCGAIGPYWGKVDESSLFTIFVLPEYHGQGIGRKIIAFKPLRLAASTSVHRFITPLTLAARML